MLNEVNVTILRKGDHLEVFQDGLMVSKKESVRKILSEGECEEFYDNWVYEVDHDANEKLGRIIHGLMTGDYAKVE
ncbi:hypothetical protein GH808_00080 [Acetobacterium fimetarium]|uniref:Uncharacterized protein n=1 Tax=Acetobacterium fimetarium TaxID=52691 RepID=A0ABR6WQG9_9FIRM|nr:hypothetical protein [Acetobacterium fimetarium]MBC3802839.1 hypothetical protein [Acetobacterium fimetarium]